jgi:uncharacterized membrane-anchored protein
MDINAFGLIAIMAVMVSACFLAFLGYLKAMRRAGSESRRRLIARAAIATWASLAVLTPIIMLSALEILPRWICGVAIVIACVISIFAARHARRSTMRMHSFS